jgi:prephenate dehydrogenase
LTSNWFAVAFAHPLHGPADHLDQVEGAPLVAIRRRKPLQRIDDVARALGALHRAVDQRRQVVQHVVDAQFGAQRFALNHSGMSP